MSSCEDTGLWHREGLPRSFRDLNALEQAAKEGESPVFGCENASFVVPFQRVGLLESAALSGWYTSSKAKY